MSTVEVVHQRLLSALLKGELQPGEWLRQDDIAASLGVSKIPVREALQRLAAEGLVTFEANRGSMVRRLTADDADEIYALRLSIEPMLLRRSIPGLTIVDLAEAEHALADSSLSTGEANWAFHRALYAGAGWTRAVSIAGSLHAVVAPYVVHYTEDLAGSIVSEAQHEELLSHCRSRRVREAVSVLRTHLTGASRVLVDDLRRVG